MGSYLTTNQALGVNEHLTSDNGCFIVVMQGDGNLVVYAKDPANTLIWVRGAAMGDHAVMQGDGNFVIYTPNGVPVWGSGVTPGAAAGPFYAIIQNWGDFVVYAGAANPGVPANQIWDSGRWPALLSVTASNIV